MDAVAATRVVAGPRRGSSRPVLVDTPAGRMLVKLRGAAQGTGPLVAEMIVARLAEALGLRVPARRLVRVERDTPTDDHDAELGDLLAASVGLNLGVAFLPDARDIGASEAALDAHEAAAVLWLDRLVLNPDRTSSNPNLLSWRGATYLIDHGAALRFQYDWPAVTEATPRLAGAMPAPHLFEAAARDPEWPAWDGALARRLTRDTLEDAVADVPASFLVPMLRPAGAIDDAVRRRRAAYVAFLWKRLKAPRPFACVSPEPLLSSPAGTWRTPDPS